MALGFKFYPQDWWNSDTYYDELPEFRYIYLELIFKLYNEDNRWKVTQSRLLRLTGINVSDEVFNRLKSKFSVDEDGVWSSESIDKRIKSMRASAENGKKGGRPKKPRNNLDQNLGYEQVKPKHNLPLEIETKIETKIESKHNKNFDSLFDQFWDKYSKKVGAAKVKAKWIKMSEQDKRKALDAVDQYVKSTPELKYRKNPLTWLNGKHWEDESVSVTKDNWKVGLDPRTIKLMSS